jgi:hypothetical protein
VDEMNDKLSSQILMGDDEIIAKLLLALAEQNNHKVHHDYH